MPADRTDGGASDNRVVSAVNRCGCGRVALARCWLGESSSARWLVSCRHQAPEPPDAPEAA